MERAEAEAIYEQGRDVVVVLLRMDEQIGRLEKRVAQQEERIAQLERRLGRNSRTSSQPPSADPPGAPPRRGKDPSGRKPGGQPGHEGKGRDLLPTSAVDEVIVHWPTGCDCGHVFGEGELVGATAGPGFGADLYTDQDADGATEAAVTASLGCGVPTAVAALREGETVLDLGSGAGADVLISARRVGPTGRAIGLDMTDDMLDLARANATEAGVTNAEFIKGYIEEIPLPDQSVDVVISNCVINLAADKTRVLQEAARILRPSGRFAVSDVIADEGMDDATRADMRQWTGCVARALTQPEYERALATAGLVDVDIDITHRVHEHAASAIIHARRQSGA